MSEHYEEEDLADSATARYREQELKLKRYRFNTCAVLLGLGFILLVVILNYFGFAK